jgi:hypothetical protein
LERNIEEIFVNNYHPLLLELWEANMDIQPCGGSAGLAEYVAKFVAKAEPSNYNQQLKMLIAAGNNNGNVNQQKLLHHLSANLLSSREVCASEAAFRLCHLKMKSSSRQTVYLNTRQPHLRTRMLNIRKTLTNNQENTFCTNFIQRYEQRPTQQYPILREMNLALFAMLYKVEYNSTSIITEENVADEDALPQLEINEDATNIVNLPDVITLRDGKNTRMIKRTKPAIIKHQKLNFANNLEAFLHHFLIMHLPFNNELEIVNTQQHAVEEIFVNKIQQLQQIINSQHELYNNMPEYNRLKVELAAAINKFEHHQQQQSNNYHFNFNLKTPTLIVDEEFFNQIESLNEQQLNIMKIITSKIIRNENSNKIFITGGAGSGKSFLLQLMAQQIIRMGKKIVVASPTGCSAKLINGQTIHSCLLLPTNKNERLSKLNGIVFEQMKIQ